MDGEVSVLWLWLCLWLHSKAATAGVAFECKQRSSSASSTRCTINGQNAKVRPNQWFGAALTHHWEYTSNSVLWRWEWPLTCSVTLDIWPELCTLSGSGKRIPDYLPQVTDTSGVLHIRPLEFQLIILRLTEGRGTGRGGRVLICWLHHLPVWFVMIVNDIMMNIIIEFQCLSAPVCKTSDAQQMTDIMNN